MALSKNRFAVIASALISAAIAGLAIDRAGLAAEDDPADSLAGYYGFGPLEIYKLHQRSTNLLAADLNNDGKTDLILIDNSNSRLDVLQQRSKPADPGKPKASGKVNSIESDKRFEHRKIAV